MVQIEKKINKLLIGLVLGATAVGAGAAAASMTPQGKSFWKKVKDFFMSGWKALKEDIKKK